VAVVHVTVVDASVLAPERRGLPGAGVVLVAAVGRDGDVDLGRRRVVVVLGISSRRRGSDDGGVAVDQVDFGAVALVAVGGGRVLGLGAQELERWRQIPGRQDRCGRELGQAVLVDV